jgi:isoamylase
LYQPGGRQPYHSINFVTSHDGFTLNDLVSYNDKHNLDNGENNRDGENNNYSMNHGVEGPTRKKGVDQMRLRHIKNHLATLMLSQGVPMLVSGDECRRTQRGNNNAYCQDNEISWFDWKLVEKNADLVRFTRSLVRFRREQPTVRRTNFLLGMPTGRREMLDVNWFSSQGATINWDDPLDRSLTCLLAAPDQRDDPLGTGRDVLLLFNAEPEDRPFVLPRIARGARWRLFLDTGAESPGDVFPDFNGPLTPADGKLTLLARSMQCYVAIDGITQPGVRGRKGPAR